jgi:hypothetical protein
MIAIYVLPDPVSLVPRYVGQTKDPQRRVQDHVDQAFDGRRLDSPLYRWIRALWELGDLPELVVLEWVAEQEANERETNWIDRLRWDAAPLLNRTTGGHQAGRSPRGVSARTWRRTNAVGCTWKYPWEKP